MPWKCFACGRLHPWKGEAGVQEWLEWRCMGVVKNRWLHEFEVPSRDGNVYRWFCKECWEDLESLIVEE